MDLLLSFRNFIASQHLFGEKDRLLVAVSGGMDSVVLCECCHQAGFDFTMGGENGAVTASWSIKSRMPYPINIVKVFGGIERNMGRDFSKGLNKLKTLCEG